MLSLASARQTDKFSHVVMSGLKDCHNTNHCQLIHGGRRARGQGLPGHCNVGSRSLSSLLSSAQIQSQVRFRRRVCVHCVMQRSTCAVSCVISSCCVLKSLKKSEVLHKCCEGVSVSQVLSVMSWLVSGLGSGARCSE